jgi:uncharacterized membrane protein YuzA (DUF378 family)
MNVDSSTLKLVANILVIVGALNWLSIGAQNVNYVPQLVGGESAQYVYLLVGVAGLYLVYNMFMNYSKSGKLEQN